MKKTMFVFSFMLSLGIAYATDIINQDKKAYTVVVKEAHGGYSSTYTIKAGDSMYGLCGDTTSCVFAIRGDKIEASKQARLYIRDGKFATN